VREQRLWKLVLEFNADIPVLFNSGWHIRLSVDELSALSGNVLYSGRK
jgi:hypothetical protein